MKKKQHKFAAVFLALALAAGSLSGCGGGEGIGTKVVLTTGFDRDEVFRIETSTCSIPEIMVYLVSYAHRPLPRVLLV